MATAPPTTFRLTARNLDTALRYHAVLELLAERWREDLEILEVGSGSGGVTEFLRHPVTGVDTAFERTSDRATPWLERRVGSATALPAAGASFDVVLSLEMIEHLPAGDREPALAEMVRVLRPGGRLIVSFPAGAEAERLDRWLNEHFRARRGRDHPWASEHLREGLPDVAEMVAALSRVGGPLATVRVLDHLPGWAFRVVHGLYSLGFGDPLMTLLGLRTPPVARALFEWLRRARGRPAYRAMLVLDKPVATG